MNIQNIKLEPVEVTWGASSLGFCDGDIELKTEGSYAEITAHQLGTTVLSEIANGMPKCEVTLTLKETNTELLSYMFTSSLGDEYTPSGGTEVIGLGMSKMGALTVDDAEKLVLHPVNKDSDEYDRDWAFWKAYPKLDTLVYSGENPLSIKVTFVCYPDMTKAGEVMMGCFGDHTQDFDNA